MPFDQNGNYKRLYGPNGWQDDRDAGTNILASRHDDDDNDKAEAFNQCFLADGRKPITGNIKMGGNKISGLGGAVSLLDAANAQQVQGCAFNYASDISTEQNVIKANLTPAPSSLPQAGLVFIKVKNANTGKTTLKLNTLESKPVYVGDQEIDEGVLKAGQVYIFFYNGGLDAFQILPIGATAGTAVPPFTMIMLDHLLTGEAAIGWELQGTRCYKSKYWDQYQQLADEYAESVSRTETVEGTEFSYQVNLTTKRRFYTKNDYDKRFALCADSGGYVLDEETYSFYLPKSNNYFRPAVTADNLAGYQQDTTRKMTGYFNFDFIGNPQSKGRFDGPFYATDNTPSEGRHVYIGATGSDAWDPADVGFDTSRAGEHFAGEETAPKSRFVAVYYKMGTAYTEQSSRAVLASENYAKQAAAAVNTISAQIAQTDAAVTAAQAAQANAEGAKIKAEEAQYECAAAQAAAETAQNQAGDFASLAQNAVSSAQSIAESAGTYAASAQDSQVAAAQSAEQAKEWAIKTDGTVDGAEYSAKHYALQAAQYTSSAQTAQQAAQAAQEEAQTAQAAAENAQKGAEMAKSAAQDILSSKADKAQSLAGYGIMDAYNKEQVDKYLDAIKAVIPAEASETNPLADKNYVDNNILQGVYTQKNLLAGTGIEIVDEPVEGGIDQHTLACWHLDSNFTNAVGNDVTGRFSSSTFQTTYYKFGSASWGGNYSFNTSTISSVTANSDWTIDCWFKKWNGYAQAGGISIGNGSSNASYNYVIGGWRIDFSLNSENRNKIQIYNQSNVKVKEVDYSFEDEKWTHIAVQRKDKTLTGFVDGVPVISYTSDDILNYAQNFAIYPLVSYLDELRISDNARYSGNFEPPTQAYSVATPTGNKVINNTLDISSLVTKEEVNTGLSTKQDTISDLSTIREGAALGATSVQHEDLATDMSGKADVDLSNLSATGKSTVSEWAMPSEKYVDLTVASSSSSYTAPANGYFVVRVPFTNNQACALFNITTLVGINLNSNGGWTAYGNIPVKKNDVVQLWYNCTPDLFRFVYAEGDK